MLAFPSRWTGRANPATLGPVIANAGQGRAGGRHHAHVSAAHLQAVAAQTWLPADTEQLGDWLLRAAHGWTGRANSVLALGAPGGDLDDVLGQVHRWYAARGLPPTVSVVDPDVEDLTGALRGRGWTRRHAGLVMTCPAEVALSCTPMTDQRYQLVTGDTPDAQWLTSYAYRGVAVPPAGVELLTSGPRPQFHALLVDDQVASIARTTEGEGWTGITAVETRPEYRGRGLASAMLRLIAVRAREADAPDLWLGVDTRNTDAQRLYARCGFTVHHRYDYWSLPRPPAGPLP